MSEHEWTKHRGRFEHHTLGSYDCLIGMDWLHQHHVVLDCYNKALTCLDEEGNLRTVQGIPSVDDYSFVRHPPGHRLSESTCERAHELGVPMRWVCRSSLRLRWNVVCPCVG
jgi:hypothetical protein